jgi:hypothetical protein
LLRFDDVIRPGSGNSAVRIPFRLRHKLSTKKAPP